MNIQINHDQIQDSRVICRVPSKQVPFWRQEVVTEMEQIIEILSRMEAKMNSNQEKADANRIADRECMKQMMVRTDDS
jgi:hypothetical protein